MLPQPKDITLTRLNARFGTAPAEAALAVALDRYEGQIALVSSFGAEAAVLLHMLSRIDAGIPVLLLDTSFCFQKPCLSASPDRPLGAKGCAPDNNETQTRTDPCPDGHKLLSTA